MGRIIFFIILNIISNITIASGYNGEDIRFERRYSIEIGDSIIKPIIIDNKVPYISKELGSSECQYYLCVNLYYLNHIITDECEIGLSNNKRYKINNIKISNIKGSFYSVIIPISDKIITDLREDKYSIKSINIGYNNKLILNNCDCEFIKMSLLYI